MADPQESIEARLALLVEELAVARQETVVSRAETAASRKETALSRSETAAALVHVEHLKRALRSARVIGMAMGIVMLRHGLTEQAAFQQLVEVSQRLNRKLRDVADHLVRTGELPT